MSTENTQTAESQTTAGEVSSPAESQPNLGEASQAKASDNTSGLDGLKKLAKESAEGEFKPKPIEQAVKEAQPKPVFTPSYKYKAALQEKEVDEFWRPLMKDEESAKKVIRAMQQLDGFDAVNSSREKLNQEYQSLYQDYTEQNRLVSNVQTALRENDLSSVFRQLGVKNEDIFRWTQEQLTRMELPPEQRKAFEEAEALRAQQREVQEQMSQYQRMYEEQAVQARTVTLDLALARPEVMNAAQSWDQVMGQPGAFRDLVITEAQNVYYQTGKDLSADQAVQMVMQKFGRVLGGQAVTNTAAQAVAAHVGEAQPAPQQVRAPQSKPVIPNVTGKGTSPIKKVPKSLDDLKKLAKEVSAEGL